MTGKRVGNGRKIGPSEATPLFRAIPQRDATPLAKDLIVRFGSFAEVVAAPVALLR